MKALFKYFLIFVTLVTGILSCTEKGKKGPEQQGEILKYVMDFVHNNLGLPPRVSKFKGVIDGFEEYEYLMEPDHPKCLNDLKDSNVFSGVWTWSRGGGWLGPHLKNKFWAEQNAYVIAKWAQNPVRFAHLRNMEE